MAKILLGKIIFECTFSGKVIVEVNQEGNNVTMTSDAHLSIGALKPLGDGVQMERSVIFSLFNTMMEAQREKG